MQDLVALSSRRPALVQELAVISGKGGTGKTSIVASFATLSRRSVVVDCDVDAADLHLLLGPRVLQREPFLGGKRASITAQRCAGCGKCAEVCRFGAISPEPCVSGKKYVVDAIACEGCGVCAWFCPEKAIDFSSALMGEWFVSETRFGPMVHARLGVGAENSGKLVTTVRQNAKKIAEEQGVELVLIDGSPGIGCPVIASLTGASLVLAVTEPTVSGRHDLERVIELTRHFGIPLMLCVNKWDLNPELTRSIEQEAQELGVTLAGRIRYDRSVTEAQVQGMALTEYCQDGSAEDVRNIWMQVKRQLSQLRGNGNAATA